MPQAKSGDRVAVNYTGKLQDGTVFDSSDDREPLEFELGKGQLIPGFESAVTGMSPGESRTTEIPPEQAYGEQQCGQAATSPLLAGPGRVQAAWRRTLYGFLFRRGDSGRVRQVRLPDSIRRESL